MWQNLNNSEQVLRTGETSNYVFLAPAGRGCVCLLFNHYLALLKSFDQKHSVVVSRFSRGKWIKTNNSGQINSPAHWFAQALKYCFLWGIHPNHWFSRLLWPHGQRRAITWSRLPAAAGDQTYKNRRPVTVTSKAGMNVSEQGMW